MFKHIQFGYKFVIMMTGLLPSYEIKKFLENAGVKFL